MSWIKLADSKYVNSAEIESVEISEKWATVTMRSGKFHTALAGSDGYQSVKYLVAEANRCPRN